MQRDSGIEVGQRAGAGGVGADVVALDERPGARIDADSGAAVAATRPAGPETRSAADR